MSKKVAASDNDGELNSMPLARLTAAGMCGGGCGVDCTGANVRK
jgi:hypothetical protein